MLGGLSEYGAAAGAGAGQWRSLGIPNTPPSRGLCWWQCERRHCAGFWLRQGQVLLPEPQQRCPADFCRFFLHYSVPWCGILLCGDGRQFLPVSWLKGHCSAGQRWEAVGSSLLARQQDPGLWSSPQRVASPALTTAGSCHALFPAASMVPQRKSDFASIVLRALFTGACVSILNACVAGMVPTSCSLALGPAGEDPARDGGGKVRGKTWGRRKLHWE